MLDPKELDRIMERVEQIGSGPELEQVEAVMAWCLDKFGSLGWKEEHLIQFFSLGLSNLTEDIGPMRVDYDDGSFAIAGNSDADVMDLIGLLGEGADVQVLDIDEDDLEGYARQRSGASSCRTREYGRASKRSKDKGNSVCRRRH